MQSLRTGPDVNGSRRVAVGVAATIGGVAGFIVSLAVAGFAGLEVVAGKTSLWIFLGTVGAVPTVVVLVLAALALTRVNQTPPAMVPRTWRRLPSWATFVGGNVGVVLLVALIVTGDLFLRMSWVVVITGTGVVEGLSLATRRAIDPPRQRSHW